MKESWGEWFDRHAGTYFITPAVVLILIFAIFPTFYSIVFALSRVKFTADGLQFRFVGLQNFAKQFFGTDQNHFLGKIAPVSPIGWAFMAVVAAAVLWWLFRSAKKTTWVGMIGRSISAIMALFLAWVLGVSLLSGNTIGTLTTTLFYVIVGCAVQFVIGVGLAVLCSQPISGRSFFRVVFFIPLMVTPLGVGYAMKMVADFTKGPFEPLLRGLGLERLGLVGRPLGRPLRDDDLRFVAVDPLHLHHHAGGARERPERPGRSRTGGRRLQSADFPRDHLAANPSRGGDGHFSSAPSKPSRLSICPTS